MSYSITACLNIWEGRPHSFLLQLVDGIGGIGEYKLGFVFPKKFMFQVSWFLVYELALNLRLFLTNSDFMPFALLPISIQAG